MTINKTYFLYILVTAFLLGSSADAHNSVVVVPLGGADFKPLQNIVTVAKNNADFKDINAAINSISGEGSDNPYLVVVGPGIYTPTTQVIMKPYVSLTGSGPKSTIIKASVGSTVYADNGVVRLASNTTLSNLSVENTASTSPGYIVGVMAYQTDSLTAMVKNVSVLVGGTPDDSSRGIYSEECDIIIEDSHIVVEGTYKNYGLRNRISNTITRNTLIEVSGGSSANRGAYESNAGASGSSPYPEYDHVMISAAGTDSVGLYLSSSAPTKVRLSNISGETSSMRGNGSSIVSLSSLADGPVSGSSLTCVTTDNGAGLLLDSSCE